MSADRTYLDWNATAPLRPQARAAMLAALDTIGNPSSIHAEGRAARALVEAARAEVAALVAARPSEVVFTSGATEANTWAMRAGWDFITASAIEHESVRAHVASADLVGADAAGVADVAAMARVVLQRASGFERGLMALQLANNETGVVQPVADMAAFARAHGLTSFTDAVQAVGRVPVSFHDLGVDLLSISAHKLGGPKGVGALIIRDGVDVPALIGGGGQERRRRAGTENVAAIAGFGAAARAAHADFADWLAVATLRDELERRVCAGVPGAVVFGRDAPRLPNTTLIATPGHSAQSLLIRFDLAGVAISSGSACSSGTVGASHVLAAMGVQPDLAQSALRVSLGPTTTPADIDQFYRTWERVVAHLRHAA
jgi:cysteine desulfurase